MAAYDNVAMPGAPSPGTYAPSPIDFSALAKIPGVMQQAQTNAQQNEQYQRTRAIQTALPNGIDEFKDPKTGQYDYGALVNQLVKVAGPQGASLANDVIGAAYGSQLTGARAGVAQDLFGGGKPGNPAGAPPAQGGPAPAPETSTAPNTLIAMAQAQYGDQDAGKIAADLSTRMKVDPNAPLTPEQAATVRDALPRSAAVVNRQATDINTKGGPPFAPGMPSANNPAPKGNAFGKDEAIMPTASGAQPGSQPTPAQPMSRFDFVRQQADAARARGDKLGFLGMKEAADLEYKKADALDARAKEDPQFQATQQLAKEDVTQGTKLYQSLVGQGRTGITMTQDAKEARSLLQHPDMYTGLGAETAGKTVQLAKLLGLPVNSKLPDLQAELKKTTSNSVLNQMSLLKASSEEGGAGSAGRIFAPEVDQMIQAAASIENPTAANLYLTTIKDRTGQFLKEVGQQAAAYKKTHGTLDAGFDTQLASILGNHHAMTPQEMQDPTLLSSREFNSPQEATKAKVKPGETIRVRTGPGMLDFKYLTYGGK